MPTREARRSQVERGKHLAFHKETRIPFRAFLILASQIKPKQMTPLFYWGRKNTATPALTGAGNTGRAGRAGSAGRAGNVERNREESTGIKWVNWVLTRSFPPWWCYPSNPSSWSLSTYILRGLGKLRLGVGPGRLQSLCVLSPCGKHTFPSPLSTPMPLKYGKHRSVQEL